MGEQPSMVVRISGNIEALKKSLADGKAVIEGTTVSMQKLGSTTGGTLHQQFQKFDSVLAAMGINIGTDVRALGELSVASQTTASSLGVLTTAGLAAGAALGGWKIGRLISDLAGFDQTIGDATANLLGWGDAAEQAAGSAADTLAKASKLAGIQITDMDTAIRLLSDDAREHAEAVNTSARRVAGWGMEIAKIKADGNWEQLTEDVRSQNFELKELSERYHISVDAIQFFTRQQQKAADAQKEIDAAIVESNKKKLEGLKQAAEAADRMFVATTHLAFAQGNYADLLQHTDPALVAAVKHYQELGLSVEDTAVILDKQPEKIALISEAILHQNDVLDEAHRQWQELEAAQADACDHMLDKTLELVAKQKQAFDDARDAIIRSQHQISETVSRTYDLSTKEGMDEFKKLNPAASIGNIPPGYFDTHTLQDAIRDGLIDLYAGYKTKHFAGGVENFSGGRAIVGERGPELVTLPRGSSVTPNDKLGMTINMGGVVVNGFVGNKMELADTLFNLFIMKLRGQGVRLPGVGQ